MAGGGGGGGGGGGVRGGEMERAHSVVAAANAVSIAELTVTMAGVRMK